MQRIQKVIFVRNKFLISKKSQMYCKSIVMKQQKKFVNW